MKDVAEHVRDHGWVAIETDASIDDRRRMAELGNQLIDMAEESDRIRLALMLNTTGEGPAQYLTDYRVGQPRVADDNSKWFHSGWQSRDYFYERYGTGRPKEAVEFFDVQRTVLESVAKSWMSLFRQISEGTNADVEGSVNEMIYNQRNPMRNNHHIRIVRYPTISKYTDENPTFSAHGDLSLVTAHAYETHHGHLRVAPFPVSEVSNDPMSLPERAALAAELREAFNDAAPTYRSNEIIAFLGFAAAFVASAEYRNPFVHQSAAYHFGIPPDSAQPADANIEQDFGEDTRVVAVAFGNPHLDSPYSQYQLATKEACRPELVLERLREKLAS